MPETAAVRVGVTGHRDLAAPDAVAAAVDTVLSELAGGAPVTVVTSLAEGADRLVAGRALARAGGAIEVVLPLPVEDYRADFPGSAEEFAGLLAVAASVQVVAGAAAGSREAAYMAAGRAVVDRCDVLLALWDEEPARGHGGTAEVVAYARDRGRRVVVVPVVRAGQTASSEEGAS
ncbi:MAG: hypothetical protein R2737_15935 [Candidatus Nanopelagicales bacterium]